MAIFTGETAAKAIENGLKTLHLTRQEAKITIIEGAKKGFLGINKKEAQVKVESILPQHSGGAYLHPDLAGQTEKKDDFDHVGGVVDESVIEDPDEADIDDAEILRRQNNNKIKLNAAAGRLADYLTDILAVMQIEVNPQLSIQHQLITIDLNTDKPGLLIGHHGLTINALQAMAVVFLNQHGIQHINVILDTDNYRKRRETVLAEVAKQAATEAIATGKAVYLDSMPAMERKQVHQALTDNKFVRTYSQGDEPRRSVVVAPAGEM
ncbi:RNA-binding cell elongation regulator Jag/EloR [Paucilactobacillus wasatchensis]|uniref:RNA-binding protein KhpB n=1 Tax=Paucilactobacillus wasatchensis TaxID=1335616 RepID=A0A0D0YVW5_9LACO|nr:RNA-binding cell elongation regulator Jag/EloR [Paucilactobacillus wasatchensis]KIS03419.1 RNA-binding protein Jag [Paucilactobacillus wasatchensis]